MKPSPHTLAENKKTCWTILLAAAASKPEQHAAHELADHLKRITGVRFPIQPSGRRHSSPVLAVGPTAAIVAGLPRTSLTGLGPDGICIRSVGNNLVLTGAPNAPRGTLYAVYEFLESILGCRWWTPESSSIPRHQTLTIERQNRCYRPPFEYREALYYTSWDTRWCVRNRTNGLWEGKTGGLPATWGGHIQYAGFVHTFPTMIPPDPNFKDHPEWFAEVDGKRVPDQPCMTHPEVLNQVIQWTRSSLRAHPSASIVSVSQNDNHVYCRCRNCRSIEQREGSPAGPLLHLVNRVAQAIEPEFPDAAIDTLAYLFSRRPPRHLRPRRNVIIRLCSFECDFLHPMTHPNNAAFRRDLEGWSRICKRLYVWDYVTNFAHFILPHPNWFVLGDNVRFFRDHHVRGLFEQGNHQSPGGEMGYLRAWVLSKLLWNPDQDTARLVHEFLNGYYGHAGLHLAAYLQAIHQKALSIPYYPGSKAIQDCLRKRGYPQAREGCYLDLNAEENAPFLDADILLQSLRHLDAARQAVYGRPALVQRVDLTALPVQYAVLLRWNELRHHARRTGQAWPLPASRQTVFRSFARVCRENNITHLGESWSKRTLAWLKTEVSKP